MSNKCILRISKLKTVDDVAFSMAHTFRERDTPNADAEKTPQNTHFYSKSKAEAMALFRKKLPEKVRKNGVMAVEYMITFSPDGLKKSEDIAKYYNLAKKWIEQRHEGKVFNMTLHVDENTVPHLVAYAIPVNKKGSLSWRQFFNGKEMMSEMQTDFWEKVGKPVGLERGLKGSRAKHQTVRTWYAKTMPLEDALRPPKRKLGESEGKWAERYKAQLRPHLVASLGNGNDKKNLEMLEQRLKKLQDKKNSDLIFKLSTLSDEEKLKILAQIDNLASQKNQKNQLGISQLQDKKKSR